MNSKPMRVRLILGAVGVLVAVGGIAIPGFLIGGFENLSSISAVLFMAAAAGPFILYVLLAKTLVGATILGVALIVITGAFYAFIHTSDSSTAGFGFFASIAVNYVLALVGIGIDSVAYTVAAFKRGEGN